MLYGNINDRLECIKHWKKKSEFKYLHNLRTDIAPDIKYDRRAAGDYTL